MHVGVNSYNIVYGLELKCYMIAQGNNIKDIF